MEVRTIHYPLWHTSVQISAFIPRQGVAEYMAMVIPEPGVGDFAVQLEHIRSTIEYLLTEEWQGDVLPLLKRYFISDAANQELLLKAMRPEKCLVRRSVCGCGYAAGPGYPYAGIMDTVITLQSACLKMKEIQNNRHILF